MLMKFDILTSKIAEYELSKLVLPMSLRISSEA